MVQFLLFLIGFNSYIKSFSPFYVAQQSITRISFQSTQSNIRLIYSLKSDQLSENVAVPTVNANLKNFTKGQSINVKILQFGPLGATVDIDNTKARGLVTQKEISIFRNGREGVDIVLGEELTGYVTRVRDDGKLDVSLRPLGISRASQVKQMVLDALDGSPSNSIPVGDKSSPDEISSYFHGLSKGDFKTAVGMLYKERLVIPGPYQTVRSSETAPSIIFPTTSMQISDNTLFIGNLPNSVTESQLDEIMHKNLPFMKVLDIKMPMDSELKQPKGYAWIQLESKEEVLRAIVALKGLKISGRMIRTDVCRTPTHQSSSNTVTDQPTERQSTPTQPDAMNDPVVQEPIGSSTTPKKWLNEAKGIMNRRVLRDDKIKQMQSTAPRVNQEAQRAYKYHDETIPIRAKPSGMSIFLGNLPYSCDDNLLKQKIFEKLGDDATSYIKNIGIVMNWETGQSKGFGFIDVIDSSLDIHQIHEKLKDLKIMEREVMVDIKTNR